MGIVQKQTGNYRDAAECYNLALVTARKGRLRDEEATCYNNLGNVFRRQGDFARAMESYQKAITISGKERMKRRYPIA
jgi:tetratricopeptide (TPR) repeat protein